MDVFLFVPTQDVANHSSPLAFHTSSFRKRSLLENKASAMLIDSCH